MTFHRTIGQLARFDYYLKHNQIKFMFICATFLSFFSLINANYDQQQIIIESPSDQQSKIGDQVVLKCKIKNLKGEPQWCIDDFCLGVAKKDSSVIITNNENSFNNNQTSSTNNHLTLKGRPRHRIIGDQSKGEFHLLIEPIQLQDNMYYYCMATAASETIKAVKSKKSFLTVLTYPQSLHLDNPVHVSLNKPSAIQCTARQSRPPVKILIAINGQLITDETKYKTEIVQIPINTPQEDSNEQISTTSDESSSSLASLPVGSQLSSSNLSPNKKRISYILSTSQIPLEQMRHSFYDTITNLTIDDTTMKMQGQIVECFAYSFVNTNHLNRFSSYNNQNHKTHANLNLNLNSFQNNVMNIKSVIQVDYAPEVNLKVISTNRLLKEEDVISLVCDTRATPAIQSYKWYIGKNYLNGVGDSSLNLKLRKEMHMQTVTCEASNIVASVKASIQLNILFKPSFLKGSKSYMQIDKNACNKPLTLDCQVNANPSANITWYRRRIKRNSIYNYRYMINNNNENNEQSLNNDMLRAPYSLFSRIDNSKISTGGLNQNDNLYYDELIGTGPTYTIASFNCANVLANVRNRTMPTSSSTNSMKSIKTRTTISNNIAKTKNRIQLRHQLKEKSSTKYEFLKLSATDAKNSSSLTFKKNLREKKLNVRDSSLLTAATNTKIDENKVSSNNKINLNELNYLAEDIDYGNDLAHPLEEYEIEDDYELDDQNSNIEFDADKPSNDENDHLDDFGIYMCEARNSFLANPKPDLFPYQQFQQVSRRFIKLNPIGPPVLRVMSASMSGSSIDDLVSTMMKPALSSSSSDYSTSLKDPSSIVEIATSIGSSVSFICIVEPLPQFQTIVWIKDNGRIIPNSKYSIHDSQFKQSNFNDNEDLEIVDTTQTTPLIHSLNRMKMFRNFRIKYENLSSFHSSSSINSNENENEKLEAATVASSDNSNGITTINADVGLMRSILNIRNVRRQDLGIYKCKSSNSYGSRTAFILLREKSLMDKFNLNNYVIFISGLILLIVLFILMLTCIISKRTRNACCCCCYCMNYADKITKDKELLSHNLNCEQNSDKTINDWLASSKLSNDTGTGSLMNAVATNNTSTTTATTILNGVLVDQSCNTLSKGSKTNKMLNSPSQLRHEMAGNCSSLLNEDIDDENDVNNDSDDLSEKMVTNRNIGILNDIGDFASSTNTDSKRDEFRIGSNNVCYQTSQFSRFLVSSPLISSSSQKESFEDCHHNQDKLNNDETTPYNNSSLAGTPCSVPATALAKTIQLPPMMMIRSQNFANGNFNAKISAASNETNEQQQAQQTQRLLASSIQQHVHNSPQKQTKNQQFNTFTLTRNYETNYPNHQNNQNGQLFEKDYYENNNNNNSVGLCLNGSNNQVENDDDLAKILKDTTYRLSDLFNELSPNLIISNANNNQTNNNTISNNTNSFTNRSNTNNLYQSTLTKSTNNTNSLSKTNSNLISQNGANLLQQYPTFSLQSQHHQQQQQQQSMAQSRQTLLQAINSNQQINQTSSSPSQSFNKFPNPFSSPSSTSSNTQSTNISSNTSRFYSNFYRNPNNDQYESNGTKSQNITNNQNNNSIEDDHEIKTSTISNPHIAKIVTTSTTNGTNKYQTVV